MKKEVLAFYPYYNKTNAYIGNMISIYSKKFQVVPYNEDGITNENVKKCKAIVLNWYESKLNFYRFILLVKYKMTGKKIIWVFHNMIPHEEQKNLFSYIKMQAMILLSDVVVLHSRHSKKVLSIYNEHALKKAIFVPHVNYCNNYPLSYENYREQLGIRPNDFVFMFFGFIKPYKNVELLIKIFKDWDVQDAKLLIVGEPSDGEYAKSLKKLCDGNAKIIMDFNYVDNNKTYAYFNTSDVVVLPYHKESCINSGAMIGAFSCGKTVIIPNIAMAQDYRKLCYVYDYNHDAEHEYKLKKKLKECYQRGKDENYLLGQKAKKFMLKHNSVESVIEVSKKMFS